MNRCLTLAMSMLTRAALGAAAVLPAIPWITRQLPVAGVMVGTLAGAGGAAQAQQSTARPDFSGVWDHGIAGFEPLASGPTALVNRARRRDGTASLRLSVGDYTNPILKPEAAEVVKKFGEDQGQPDPFSECWPGGPPFDFNRVPMQLVQTANQVIILYYRDHQVRHVRLNQSHPAQVTPSWNGDSVGHYEGDTLVIDTLGIKVGPYAMVDFYGTPHTEGLHVVERYRLLDSAAAKEGFDRDAKENGFPRPREGHSPLGTKPNAQGKFLQLRFTVEDEGVFTTPWAATMTYRISPDEWEEDACAENIRWYPGKNADVPRADKPDF